MCALWAANWPCRGPYLTFAPLPQETAKEPTQQSPQDRVSLVRPLWETLAQDVRSELLTIDLDTVRARAKMLAEAARVQAGEGRRQLGTPGVRVFRPLADLAVVDVKPCFSWH